MSSTRLRNQPGEYAIEQHQKNNIFENRIHDMKRVSNLNAFPQKGINVGQTPHGVFSENPIDIENDLFGIRSSDLVNKRNISKPLLKTLPDVYFYKPMETFVPEPLVIEKNQRPVI